MNFLSRKAQEMRVYRERKGERERLAKIAKDEAREALWRPGTRTVVLDQDQVEWREEWLASAIEALHPIFAKRGYSLPDKVRASLGWTPSKKWAGVCFDSERSTGGYVEIFVCPTLADPKEILDVLTHELCHAVVGCRERHKKAFQACAAEMGLQQPWKAASGLNNPAWHEWANPVIEALGPFPHDAMTLLERKAAQATRNLKQVCGECGLTFRLAAKWIEPDGLRCPRPGCNGVVR